LDNLGLAEARERAARHRAEVVDGGDPQARRKAKREAARNLSPLMRSHSAILMNTPSRINPVGGTTMVT
jgi:hypothetical protein